MPVQVIDLLEPVEVEAEHRERTARGQMRLDLAIEPLVEGVAVRQAGERIVVSKEVNVLLRLLPVAEVAHRNDVMRLAAEIDRTKDEFGGNQLAARMPQLRLGRLVRILDQLTPCAALRNAYRKLRSDHFVGQKAGQGRKTLVDCDDRLAVANQETFDRGIGEAAHAIGFEFRTVTFADVESEARRRRATVSSRMRPRRLSRANSSAGPTRVQRSWDRE